VVGPGAPFRLFSPAHLAALAVTATAAVVLARMVGGRPASRRIRFGLALFLVATIVAWLLHEAARRPLSVWDVLPLHLCDFLVLVAVYALLTLRRLACELLYFWSVGTLLAMVTPDLGFGFPHPAFLVYFALHGAVVVAAAVVVLGLGQRPQPGAPWRAFGATLAYAAGVGVVDHALGANFLYLCRKPYEPTLLDAFGPWPIYLVTVALFALGLFHLMAWPFRRGVRITARPASASEAPTPSPASRGERGRDGR
jgi:hypothetical integral membrane protein (TIGR02206 family)